MTENYSFSKEERLGIYEIVEKVYKSHERRLRNLESMVDLLRHDIARIQREQYAPSVSRDAFRLSDWVRDYYSPHLFQEEQIEPNPIPLRKATEQISQFIMKNPEVTTSDIIRKLELDPGLVNRVLSRLEKEGKIRGRDV